MNRTPEPANDTRGILHHTTPMRGFDVLRLKDLAGRIYYEGHNSPLDLTVLQLKNEFMFRSLSSFLYCLIAEGLIFLPFSNSSDESLSSW